MARRIVLCVTNDLVGDQRLHRMAMALSQWGFQVMVVGRMLPESEPLAKFPYSFHRMRLFFRRGPLFYAEFNLRLFIFLLLKRVEVVTANDLDTLPACWLAARLKAARLVFDSHEWFTEVPELVHRPFPKRVWQWLADRLIPRSDKALTVCNSIASALGHRYHMAFVTVRNVPFRLEAPHLLLPDERFGGRKLVIYQGAVNLGRGIDLMMEAMAFLPSFGLVVAGSGDLLADYQARSIRMDHHHRIFFLGRIPFQSLSNITLQATLGLSLEENLGKSYFYALPNKLFDYIQARIPVIVSSLPEMEALVKDYGVGRVLRERNPRALADMILEMERNRGDYMEALEKAAQELCWEKESILLKEVYRF